MSSKDVQTFVVYVDDNFHYMDEEERYKGGEFNTYEEALEFCKKIVDEFLDDSHAKTPKISEQELFKAYTSFGEDPFISPTTSDTPRFSAWDYARERCRVLCSG